MWPRDIAEERARLQAGVPRFDSDAAFAEIERSLGRPLSEMFASLERVPVASASIAQVHLATLKDGREVAVKVLRPAVELAIAKDLALLQTAASLVERLSPQGRRLKPREVVAEFARHLDEELDLMREAANASQLRRNFANSRLLEVPEVYWELCSERVMVMERMHGVPISQISALLEIYFGKLLLRLFQTSRRFNVEVQPQLVMLQKTLLNIEGLGRELDPELDLWTTAKPFLEHWMNEQIGWRGLVRTLRREAPYWANALPQLPRLVHRALAEDRLGALQVAVDRLTARNARRKGLLGALLVVLVAALILLGVGLF